MTMDWTREQTVRLIRSLKKQEILWNSRSKSYRDRRKKAIAWATVETEVGIPVEICKRRVESLLASCRREKNKILKSKASDEPEFVYEPKWVFWKEFRFLRGVPDDDNEPIDMNLDGSELPHWSASARRPPRKRRKAGEAPVKTQDDTNWVAAKPQRDGDEHDAFGITVAAKLRKMDESQRLFAENIINQALYKGMLFQLSAQTEMDFMHQPRVQQQQQQQQQDSLANPQWQTHTFAAPNATYVPKPSHPVVSHQPRQEPGEDFKQINML